MKVTRREVVALAMAGVAVAQDAPEDQYRQNAEAFDKITLPMQIEPAFAFKV